MAEVSLPDRIQIEGVCCKGYGFIPKFVMQDKDLSITAKAIYAYFCSLSGKGDSSFPSQETIRGHLQLGNKAYYKHREMLITQGYIEVDHRRVGNQQFTQNLYILISNPKKFEEAPQNDNWKSRVYGQIRIEGIRKAGYGLIPRAVMYDDRLDAKAKGLYAYFASYAGSDGQAFPAVPKLLEELDVAKETYRKALNALLDCNYIEVRQRNGQIEGKRGFNVNDYFLIDSPQPKKAQTRKAQAKKAETKKAQPTESQARKAQPKKENAIKTSLSLMISSSSNINPSINSEQTMDGSMEEKIPASVYEDMIKESIFYEDIPLLSPSTDMNLVDSLVKLMAATCVGGGKVRIGQEEVPRERIREVFLRMEGETLLYAIECVQKQKTQIRNIRAYYLTALFHAEETKDAYYANLVAADTEF